MFWRERKRLSLVSLALAVALLAAPAGAATRHYVEMAAKAGPPSAWSQLLIWLQKLPRFTATANSTATTCESGSAIHPDGKPRCATAETNSDSGPMIDPDGAK